MSEHTLVGQQLHAEVHPGAVIVYPPTYDPLEIYMALSTNSVRFYNEKQVQLAYFAQRNAQGEKPDATNARTILRERIKHGEHMQATFRRWTDALEEEVRNGRDIAALAMSLITRALEEEREP